MMFKYILACLCISSLVLALPAADKVAEKAEKILAGNDSNDKKQIVAQLASGGEDEVRIPLLIKALSDRQASKFALAAIEKRTGLKPALRAGTNPGYPGYPKTRDASGWSAWWSAKQAEKAEKEKLKKLEEEAKEAKEVAEKAAKGETEESDEAKEGEQEEAKEVVEKKKIPDHEKYGKLDRIIFKNGNLLMCYITSKQIDLDGNLTSLDIVHKNGAGQESLDAKMISSYEEDVK